MESFAAGPNGRGRPNELKDLRVDSWSHLNSDKPVPHAHALKISRFKQCLEQYDTSQFISDSFTVTVGGIKSHWEFRVYPNGYDDENSNFLGIFVKHKEGNANRYLIKSVIQLLDTRGEKKVAVDLPGKILSSKQMHGTKKYIERDNLMNNSQLYVDDSITFLLEAEICQPGTRTSAVEVLDVDKATPVHEFQLASYCTLGGDFSELMEAGDFSDVKIQCEGREFKCHKAVLSCRSAVFQAMFQQRNQNMVEQQKNVVDIVDLSAGTVERMLKYVYSGQLVNNEEDNELLAAADKYDLTDLKSCCERSLAASLSNHNCVDLLILADRHTAVNLRKSAMAFVLGNLSSVVKSVNWQQRLTPYPEIMAQIIQEMAKDGQPRVKRRKKERVPVNREVMAVIFNDTESESEMYGNVRDNDLQPDLEH